MNSVLDIMKTIMIMVIGVLLGGIAVIIFMDTNESPFFMYLKSIRQMNTLYNKGDVAGVIAESKVADVYYSRCIASGDIIIVSLNKDDEQKVTKDLLDHSFRYYLSGSQSLGGQRIPGIFGLERTEYAMLMKDSNAFRRLLDHSSADISP